MRRGEKAPPVYRASRVGMTRTVPFKRPETDSLPKHECEHSGCGTGNYFGPGSILIRSNGGEFVSCCSWGCVSRYAIGQELRS